ncbi:hypothetical protein AX16_009136 [Volvariella volvacea WC 439]|nr:hypothetical protein AX16_009136 [Volvariella volvacea WC 439]
MASTSKPIQEVSTLELYESWSDTYDTDGNVLQQLDDELFTELLPTFFPSSSTSDQSPHSTTDSFPQPQTLTVLDLGCGTGRNTQKLVRSLPTGSTLVALDPSPSMLERAKAKVSLIPDVQSGRVEVQWVVGDVGNLPDDLKVDAVVSTLVLEHVPLEIYFKGLAGVLRRGGWAYVSDMHPEMGVSRAGYLGQDGVKRLGTSWQHSTEDTIEAARIEGLVLHGERAFERGVEDEERARALGRRAEKWIGKKMLSAFVFDKI